MTKKIIIDAGHGGVLFGEYLTAGKRSPEVPPGIYEGAWNREIAGLLAARLKGMGVDAEMLTPGPLDIPESVKAASGRAMVKRFGAENVLWLSIHANASPNKGWDEKARGACAFVKRDSRKTQDEIMAEKILSAWCAGTGLSSRGVKEKGFNILFAAPVSILLESFFMTSKQDCEIARAQYPSGIAAIADVIKEWAQ